MAAAHLAATKSFSTNRQTNANPKEDSASGAPPRRANETAATTEAKDDENGVAGVGFGGFSSPAPSPSLSAVVSSMDLGLRASLAQIAGKETKAVLHDHVDALFGPYNRYRSATEKARGAKSFDEFRGIAGDYPGSDVCGNASVAPLDALGR